jgi:ketosteroid isomerase-like protein
MASADENAHAAKDYEAERELRRVNEEWARALAQRDGAALNGLMTDDFLVAFPFDGDDKGQFIADVVAGEVRVESLQAHSATILVSGSTGLVFGSETAKWHYKDRDLSGTYRFLRVYTRQKGKWQILALHLCAPRH